MIVPSSNVTCDHLSVASVTPTSLPSTIGLVGVGNGIFIPRSAIRIAPFFQAQLACSLAFAQRARTAFLALSLRCSGVIFAARAGPPFLPPLRPNATAYGFF